MKQLETFYDECIEIKIMQCDLKALPLNGRPHCTRRLAERKLAQAVFLEDRKNQLIKDMIEAKVGRDLSCIGSFLNRSFEDSFPEAVFLKRSIQHGREMVVNENGHPPHNGSVSKQCGATSANRQSGQYSENWDNRFEAPWSDGSLIADEDELF